MEGIERFNGAPKIPDGTEVEGLTLDELNLTSALQLIERIEAQGEIETNNSEVIGMIDDLNEQVKSFKDAGLPVPEELSFVIQELERLRERKQLSVRELITREVPKGEREEAAAKMRKELEDLANQNQ